MKIFVIMFLMVLVGCSDRHRPRVYPAEIEKFSNVCHKNDGVEYFIMECAAYVDKRECKVLAAKCNDGAFLSNNAIKLQMEKTQ